MLMHELRLELLVHTIKVRKPHFLHTIKVRKPHILLVQQV